MYDANGDDYVSPYLLRPLRRLEQVQQAVRGGDLTATDVSRSPGREGLPAAGAAPRPGNNSAGPALGSTKE